ncbi:hypothetical protein, partial [Nocardia cyriacigeorgica]|uniref:hypothetical protein n=1 Tax=Nocardia cyriacigeorgica TaxID=135487 RepID=UPI002456F420
RVPVATPSVSTAETVTAAESVVTAEPAAMTADDAMARIPARTATNVSITGRSTGVHLISVVDNAATEL